MLGNFMQFLHGETWVETGWWCGTWILYAFMFPYIGHVIPTDEFIFFRGVGIPPTRHC